jgi:hypothetical protein
MDVQTLETTERPPTSEDLRKALLDRANEYAELTKTASGKKFSLSTVSDRCAGDGKFLPEMAAGGNFTVDRYTKAMAWFDAHWPESGA